MRTTTAGLLLSLAAAQDLQGACISCSDARLRCELECDLPEGLAAADGGAACGAACASAAAECTDDEAARACHTCALDCAVVLEAGLLRCAREGASTATVGTVRAGQDACAAGVGTACDACMDACRDPELRLFGGWTAEAENGAQALPTATTRESLAARFGGDGAQSAYAARRNHASAQRAAALAAAVAAAAAAEAGGGGLVGAGVVRAAGTVILAILAAGFVVVAVLGGGGGGAGRRGGGLVGPAAVVGYARVGLGDPSSTSR